MRRTVACAQMPPVVTLWSTCMAIPIRTPLQTTGGSASSSSKSAEFNIAAVFSCVYFIIYYLIRFSGNWSATVKHYRVGLQAIECHSVIKTKNMCSIIN